MPDKREDSTPSVIEQAKSKGWDAGFYDFGKAEVEGITRFNPGLVERPDGLWLISRVSEHDNNFRFGQNSLWAFMLDEDGKTPKMGMRLKFPVDNPLQHFEDARAIYDPRLNQVHIVCCTFLWYGDEEKPWTGAHQCFGSFDQDWECKQISYPKFGGNPGQMEDISDHRNYEKNWVTWQQNGNLRLLYKSKPWIVCEFGEHWEDREVHTNEKGATWKYGELRGGTPPILAPGLDGKDLYWTFPHSSLPWKSDRRRYYAGAIGFETEPPYKPVLITPEPMLAGSQQDLWNLGKPPCIFPCGSLLRNGKWLISAGVNDLRSAWFEIPHNDILELVKPITDTITPIFQKTGLSEEEQKKERLRQNAARAREALRIKREKGLIPSKRIKRAKKLAKQTVEA